MGSKMIIGAICILFLATQTHAADFNVKKYGAKADGESDDAPAFTTAWKEACAATQASKIVIPGGTYLVGPVTFKGPCQAPITIQLSGTLKAPADTNKFNSQDGWFIFIGIDGLTMNGGGTFDGQGKQVWANTKCPTTGKCNYPTSLRFTSITNSIIRDITSLDSKFFHVNVLNCKNMTLHHITITAPEDSPNTDGIHVGRSTGINITDTNIGTGDDCVSLGDGSQQINVERVKCGPGHGISIGSLGKYHNEEPVTGVTVKSCNLTNTMWGARVKTWPASPSGIASDLHFEDLTMKNVSLPILIDQEYCPWSKCNLQQPSRVRISNVSFRRIRGTSATQLAVKLLCSKGVPCQQVDIADIDITYNGKEGPATSECANVKPTISGKQNPPSCGTNSP